MSKTTEQAVTAGKTVRCDCCDRSMDGLQVGAEAMRGVMCADCYPHCYGWGFCRVLHPERTEPLLNRHSYVKRVDGKLVPLPPPPPRDPNAPPPLTEADALRARLATVTAQCDRYRDLLERALPWLADVQCASMQDGDALTAFEAEIRAALPATEGARE